MYGSGLPSTSYGAAKFAVRGFSEALIEDLRSHAPHVKVAVVMPGSVATNLMTNSKRVLGAHNVGDLSDPRALLVGLGAPVEHATYEQFERISTSFQQVCRELGFVSPVAEFGTTVLDGIRAGRWRIISGVDANRLDRLVRADPENAYEPDGAMLVPPWIALLGTLRALLDPGEASACPQATNCGWMAKSQSVCGSTVPKSLSARCLRRHLSRPSPCAIAYYANSSFKNGGLMTLSPPANWRSRATAAR